MPVDDEVGIYDEGPEQLEALDSVKSNMKFSD